MTRVYRGVVLTGLLLCACAGPDKAPAPPQRDVDPTIAVLHDSIRADSTNWRLYMTLADQLRHKGRLDEASQAADAAFMLAPSPGNDARLEIAKVHAAANRPAAAINLVKEVEKKRAAGEPVDEVKIAEVYAVLGDTEAVFRWLDRALQAKSPSMQTLKSNTDFLGVQKDPRWAVYVGPQD